MICGQIVNCSTASSLRSARLWLVVIILPEQAPMFTLLRILAYLSRMAVTGGWLLVGLLAGSP
jgi:hypothetical protein